jgi:hypothetical protein
MKSTSTVRSRIRPPWRHSRKQVFEIPGAVHDAAPTGIACPTPAQFLKVWIGFS